MGLDGWGSGKFKSVTSQRKANLFNMTATKALILLNILSQIRIRTNVSSLFFQIILHGINAEIEIYKQRACL